MVRSAPYGATAVHRPNGVYFVDSHGRQLKGRTMPPYRMGNIADVPADGGLGAINPAWVSSLYWQKPDGASPFLRFSADWTVPQDPQGSITNGQTVFLFLSLMTSDMKEIIQPVLQYGNPLDKDGLGGALWLLRSWSIGPGNAPVPQQGSPLTVNQGESYSSAIDVEVADGVFTCTASFTGPNGVYYSQLERRTQFLGEPVWATVTLETYHMGSRIDYPQTDPIQFTSVSLTDQTGAVMAPAWSTLTQYGVPGCSNAGLCPSQCLPGDGDSVNFYLCA